MEWLNFLKILVNGPMVVLGNCDRINAWLPMYPLCKRIRPSHSLLIFYLPHFCLGLPFGFSAKQALSLFLFFFFTLLLRRLPFRVFNLPFFVALIFAYTALSVFQPSELFFLAKAQEGKYHNLQPLQTWCFQTTISDVIFLQLIHVGWLSERVCI